MFNVSAQVTVTGCLYNDEVYTSKISGNYGDSSSPGPKTSLSSGYCSWGPVATATPCKICEFGANNGGNCKGGGSFFAGVEGTFTEVLCPLDDYLLVLFGFTTLVGVSLIRKAF